MAAPLPMGLVDKTLADLASIRQQLDDALGLFAAAGRPLTHDEQREKARLQRLIALFDMVGRI